jgi:hypothetical protein
MYISAGTSPSDATFQAELDQIGSLPCNPRIFAEDFSNPTARQLFPTDPRAANRHENCGKFFYYEDCGIHQVKRTTRCMLRFVCPHCAQITSDAYTKRFSRLAEHVGQVTIGEILKPCDGTQYEIQRCLNGISALIHSFSPDVWLLFAHEWINGYLRVNYLYYGPHEPTAAMRRRWQDTKITAGLYLPQHLPGLLANFFKPSLSDSPKARAEQHRIFGNARQLRSGGRKLRSYLLTAETPHTNNSDPLDQNSGDRRPKCKCCARRVERRSSEVHVSTIITDRKQLHWHVLRR